MFKTSYLTSSALPPPAQAPHSCTGERKEPERKQSARRFFDQEVRRIQLAHKPKPHSQQLPPQNRCPTLAPGLKRGPGSTCSWGLDSKLNVSLGNSAGYPQAIAGGGHNAACEAGAFPAGIYPVTGNLFELYAFLGETRLHITAATNTNRGRRSRFRSCHQGILVVKALQFSA